MRKPSASLAVSILALAVATTGTAGAAGGWINGSRIKPHSITSKQIKQHAITKQALADGVVINVIAPIGPKGDPGATGPIAVGPQGDQGPAGAVGQPGPTQIHTVTATGSTDAVTATCDPKEIVLGGGGSYEDPAAASLAGAAITGSFGNFRGVNVAPTDAEGWVVYGTHASGLQIVVFAICAIP